MALAHIHYNTLDKNEQWQLSAFMHFLGKKQCCVTWPKRRWHVPLHLHSPEGESNEHQKKIAVLFGGPVYLEYLLLSSKNISLAYHLHNSYSFGFHKNSNKLILLLNGKDIRKIQRLGGIERRKERSAQKKRLRWKYVKAKLPMKDYWE